MSKTNAMRILDSHKIKYSVFSYEYKDNKIDGVEVAKKIGKDPIQVYKTLVTQGTSKEIYVFVIPVEKELDLKKAAIIAGEKKIDMIAVKDINKYTGYIRGGCSPIGQKKKYKTFIDESASEIDYIIVSGGKIGLQIEMLVSDLLLIAEGSLEDLTKNV
ncbi:Cys-tRNA(Pro) deacylase [Clostridium paridis]|uniref:Cys-tRNA(Pro)/Cys-tRNA(Cys) deacylase n=1 Tax=Clostridium paridis TaxID=2803863 RepID=A0A937FAY5_9CLOT|nr:Cys-tRNA(Pro) deacylase [Clostridium paridis]MBL4930755.1 Cys-tRNA(Pro) deacylase [Clostridium paridis]